MKKLTICSIVILATYLLFNGVYADFTGGLVAHYPFDGNANDVVGGNHGTEYGGIIYLSGKSQQAASFDGNNYITIPDGTDFDALTGANDFTMNLWVNFRSYDPDLHSTFIEQSESHLSRWHWYFKNNSIRYGYHDSLQWHAIEPVSWIPSLNEWNNLTLQRQDNTVRVYVNGQLLDSSVFPESVINPFAPLRIGFMEEFQTGLDGIIDEFRIYNRALWYQSIRGRYGRRWL